MVKHLRPFLKGESGQAMVEMALVLPLLLMLLLGIFEFGRIFGSYMVISNLARDGVRYGVVGHNDSEIENRILSGRAWLDEDNITITIAPSFADRHKGDSLNVTVNYPVTLMTPFLANILPDPVPLSAQCLMRVE